MLLSLGSASPMLAAMRRCGSLVEFSLMTVNATWPGLRCFKPSLREMSLQLGGKMEETRTMLHAAMPALRRANSKLESLSRCFPTPFVAKKIFLTKGVGKHRERLSSFELDLRNAGIAACNHVRVSSLFPPICKLISRS